MSKDNQFFKEQYEAFLSSIKKKDKSALAWLNYKYFGVKEMLAYNNYTAFKMMIKVNFIEALELIKRNPNLLEDDIYQVITQDEYYLFSCAAENGALDSMKWIMENASQSAHSFLTKGPYKAFKIAMQKGYAEVADQIKKWVDEKLLGESDGIISDLKDIEEKWFSSKLKGFKTAVKSRDVAAINEIRAWFEKFLLIEEFEDIIADFKKIKDAYLQERNKKRTFSEIESHDVEKRDGESWAKRVKRDNDHTVSLRI